MNSDAEQEPPSPSASLAAFLASGGLNAGTPVAIASVPVRATAPAANARRRSRIVTGSSRLRRLARRTGVYVAPGSPSTTIRYDARRAIMSSADPTNR